MNAVIKPGVMNILSNTTGPSKTGGFEGTPPPKPKRKSAWERVKGFVKKSWGYFASAALLLTPVLNAVSRLRESLNNPQQRRNNRGRRDSGSMAWAG